MNKQIRNLFAAMAAICAAAAIVCVISDAKVLACAFATEMLFTLFVAAVADCESKQ
jgi:hypothetical protein